MTKHHVIERIDCRTQGLVYHEHAARYHFAASHLRPGRTLDVACGVGYGACLLRQHSDVSVFGVDVDRPSLQQARQTITDPRVSFLAASGPFLPFRDACFQNVVTLETIEHVDDDQGFLREIARVLDPRGVCILSTPNRAYSSKHGIVNPYHVREYSGEELRALLQKYFAVVRFSYQGFSPRFQDQVRRYSEAIRVQKQGLSRSFRFTIDHVYRPMKRWIPAGMTNFFVHRLLGLAYPRPDLADLIITSEPLEETSVFISVCEQPRLE